MYSYGPPHMAVQKQDDQHEHTFSSYVRIRDVVLKTYLGWWTIGRNGERGSGISVLPARHDDDDDDDDNWYIRILRDICKIGRLQYIDFIETTKALSSDICQATSIRSLLKNSVNKIN